MKAHSAAASHNHSQIFLGLMQRYPSGGRNSKSQAPSSKKIPNSKSQPRTTPERSFGAWDLEIVWSLELGIWSFSFPPSQPNQAADEQHSPRHAGQQNPLGLLQLGGAHQI